MPRLMSRVRVPSPAFRIQTRSTTLRVFLLNSYYINPLSQTLLSDSIGDSVARFRCSFPLLIPLLESVCVSSRWKVLSGEFRRRPTSLAVKLRKSDRVGRRGLFEPREDFPRLHTYAIRLLIPCSNLFAYPAAGKFSRASSAGGRRHLRSNFVNRILSVAEDCLSPERTFHG